MTILYSCKRSRASSARSVPRFCLPPVSIGDRRSAPSGPRETTTTGVAMAQTANTRVTFDGKPVTARTRDALKYAQSLWRKRGGHTLSIRLAQGSFSGGSVAASGSTHDGDAVVDCRTTGVGLDAQQIKDLNRALRDAGFASWIRDSRDGMDPHIHAILIGDKQMAPSAARQVESFDKGRNGLRNNAKDRNTYRPDPPVRYNYAKGKPVPR